MACSPFRFQMTLSQEVFSADLNFLVSETGKEFVGVSPAGILNKVFLGSFNTLDEGYEVMLNGNEVIIDAKILLNGSAYETKPTKGAVIKDRDSNHFKVMEVTKEDFGPGYVISVASRYQRA